MIFVIKRSNPKAMLLSIVGLLVFASGQAAAALSQAYCSSQNTGSDFSSVTNLYQSNGACFETCKANYALAVVQGNKCWCSNYVPADTVSTGSCDENCPGYPAEYCGSSSKGLFGYVALNNSPSGTAGGSSSKTSSSSDPVTTTTTSIVSPSTNSAPTTTTTPTSTTLHSMSSTSSPTPSSSTTFTTDTSSWSPTPIISLLTVTGRVKTITITPTQPPKATAPPQPVNNGNGLFSHPGKIAGLFIGIGILLILIGAGSVIFCVRRYNRRAPPPVDEYRAGDATPQRRPSRISQMGLLAGGRGPLGEKILAPIQTGGWGTGISNKSPETSSPLDKRGSYPLVVDQRLDPGTLWSPHHDNDSRISVRSLQDDQDYSRRMLRIANPDA